MRVGVQIECLRDLFGSCSCSDSGEQTQRGNRSEPERGTLDKPVDCSMSQLLMLQFAGGGGTFVGSAVSGQLSADFRPRA